MIILSKVVLASTVVAALASTIAGLTNTGGAVAALTGTAQGSVGHAEAADLRARQMHSATAEQAALDSERGTPTALASDARGAVVCPASACDLATMFRMAH